MARVTMLVTNPVRGDNRVLKEAAALRDAGHEVVFVGRAPVGKSAETVEIDGFRVHLVQDRNRFRTKLADGFQARSKRLQSGYVEVRDRLRETAVRLAPGEIPKRAAGKAAGAVTKGLLAPAYRGLSKSHAGVYRLTNRLTWKAEPFFFLHDWYEAVDELGDVIEADVWHAHDLDTLPAALKLRDRFGGKVIYDAHEYWLDCNNAYTAFAKLAWEKLERKYIGRADAVVTVSESIARYLAEKYGVAKPGVVLNTPLFREAAGSDALRDEFKIEPEKSILLYVGLITAGRGYEVLLEAMRRLPEAVLVIMGPGDEAYKAELKEKAVALGIGDQWLYKAPVGVDEIQSVTASADVGIVAVQRDALSYELCLPSKFFEYLFAGIPVAVSDLPELRPLVDRYAAGASFDETDAASIAEAVRSVLSNESSYQGDAWESRRKQIAADFAWQQRQEDLLAVYRSLGHPDGAGV